MEDRQRIDQLKVSLQISRMTEINPTPFQMYSGDSRLGISPKLYLASESPTYGWIDDLVRDTRMSLRRALEACS